MRAFVHEYGELKMKEMTEPFADQGLVRVALKTAGLNRRDSFVPVRRGEDAAALILGSDGAGVVDAVGEGVTDFSEGDEVIINPSLNWFNNAEAPPEGFDILGMPDHGTFAESIVLKPDQLEKKPEHLTWEEAGVLALSAMTGYRALFTKGKIHEGETLFIPGAGSGVATYLIQFAKAAGARVIVSSRSADKREKAEALGADLAIDTNSDWTEVLRDETVDIVIDSVGAATLNRSLEVVKKGGRVIVFGATAGDTAEIDLRAFFYGQYKLIGSTMASRDELRAMIELIENHKIHPVVDRTYQLDEGAEALDYLSESKQFGKISINI
ncbi:putative zinc-type alcohol dehydrogenase-like protein YogA [Lentibacillus sp. JNUCC-1]|uniref:zinc-binding dehydrogenase n=1 Tax=Lentibacillus sp. JNUCC-1 TaxID=2654513 RepID=UPI0012E821CD|nr:zinc-binding dehydrogenase [Lentibacillus sp. JNUCC-1]MUV36851.1 putative zinc-type alcohol dehydrogenase-like protein YogA [Lentibacillus sp. JNUCC-1]